MPGSLGALSFLEAARVEAATPGVAPSSSALPVATHDAPENEGVLDSNPLTVLTTETTEDQKICEISTRSTYANQGKRPV